MSNQSNNNGRAFEWIVQACLNLCLVGGANPTAITMADIMQEVLRINPKHQITLPNETCNNHCDSARKLAGFLVSIITSGSKVDRIEDYGDSRSASDLDPSDLGVVFSNKSVLGISCKANHRATSHDRVSANKNKETVVNWLDSCWLNTNKSTVESFWKNINSLFDEFEKNTGATCSIYWNKLDKSMKYQLYTDTAREVCSLLSIAIQDPRNTKKLLKRIFGSRSYFKVITDSNNKKVTIQPVLIDYPSVQNPIPLSSSKSRIALKGISLANLNATLSPKTALLGRNQFEQLVIVGTTNANCWEWRGRLHNAEKNYKRSLKFDFQIYPKDALEKNFGKPLII